MKKSIEINVITSYIEEQSNADENQFAHSYTINIKNNSNTGAQLLTRHWEIQDETGNTETVVGEGVIGKQPYISAGESFEYSSGTVIKTPTAIMKGSYTMIGDNGERFSVDIPEFLLSESHTLH